MREKILELIKEYLRVGEDDFWTALYFRNCLERYGSENIKSIIIKTSNLGYDCGVYRVMTNLPLNRLREIDKKYGMQTRSQSTSITQLKEGSEKEGFVFEYESIIKPDGSFDPKSRDYFADYSANSGNY